MSIERPTPEFIELLKRSGSSDKAVAVEAQREIAKALEHLSERGSFWRCCYFDLRNHAS